MSDCYWPEADADAWQLPANSCHLLPAESALGFPRQHQHRGLSLIITWLFIGVKQVRW